MMSLGYSVKSTQHTGTPCNIPEYNRHALGKPNQFKLKHQYSVDYTLAQTFHTLAVIRFLSQITHCKKYSVKMATSAWLLQFQGSQVGSMIKGIPQHNYNS